MSKHLLRGVVIASLAMAALAFTVPARAEGTNTPPAKPEKPKSHQFTGVIESVDAKAGTLALKQRDDVKTFKTTAKTKVSTEEKKEAELADLKVGDKVVVHYIKDGDDMIAQRISPPRK